MRPRLETMRQGGLLATWRAAPNFQRDPSRLGFVQVWPMIFRLRRLLESQSTNPEFVFARCDWRRNQVDSSRPFLEICFHAFANQA